MKNNLLVFFYLISINKVYNELSKSNDQIKNHLKEANFKLSKINGNFSNEQNSLGILKYLDIPKSINSSKKLINDSINLKTIESIHGNKNHSNPLKTVNFLKNKKIPTLNFKSYKVFKSSEFLEPLQILDSNQNLSFLKYKNFYNFKLPKSLFLFEENQNLGKNEILSLINNLKLIKNIDQSSLKNSEKNFNINRSDDLNKKKKNKCNCECEKNLFITVPKYKYIDIPLAKVVSNNKKNLKTLSSNKVYKADKKKKLKKFSELNEKKIGFNRKKRKAKNNYISRSLYNDYDNNVDDFDYNSDSDKPDKNDFDYSSKANKKSKEQIEDNDKVIFDELEDEYTSNNKHEQIDNTNKFGDKVFNSDDYDNLNNKPSKKYDYLFEKPNKRFNNDRPVRKNRYRENYEDIYDEDKEDSEDYDNKNQDDYENKKTNNDQEEDYDEN